MKNLLAIGLCLIGLTLFGQGEFQAFVHEQATQMEDKVIEWRRYLHEHPELSNREFETAAMVAKHLQALGMEVRTEVGLTGVVGILRGGKPGKTVALRADMDGLPVTERVDIPFASKVTTTFLGQETGVMHACGHDTHVAMLMGAAEILAGMKADVPGTVVFIFQPAEEGAPPGEEGGAELMVKEGVLKEPAVDAIFGIHINSKTPVGEVRFKPGGALAAVNRLVIRVKGKQTHGSTPWTGVDPVTVSAQIILGLQTIVSRQTELTKEAAVISIGKITGGVRSNIIPEEVEMIGTIRTLDPEMQREIHERIRRTVTHIAEASGATAEVEIEKGYPVTYNDPELTRAMGKTMQAVAGVDNVVLTRARTGAEDFSFYAEEIPGLFVFLGGMPAGQDPAEAAPHHTPDFYIDESGLQLGVELYTNFALDYLLLMND
ncbi:amidohydrolase [Lewinella cohaerens]|uniref:amidohydrolase n=1 Tax=Lewinella cohaerens TaxID=70995 RepID=UPI0003707ACF|nr:amidohydrolase [Lewinella cohaerens]